MYRTREELLGNDMAEESAKCSINYALKIKSYFHVLLTQSQ